MWLALTEGKEPLTAWLGSLWIHAGVQYLTAVRLVSVVAGLVTLVMLGVLGRRISPAAAVVAMALYAGLPYFVVLDSQGLMEPTVTAASLVVLWAAVRLAERPAAWVGIPLGLAAGAAVLTKASGWFAVLMAPLGLLAFDFSPTGRAQRLRRWAAGLAVGGALCAAAFALLVGSPLWNTYRAQRGQYSHSLAYPLEHPHGWASGEAWPVLRGLGAYAGPLLGLLALAGLVVLLRADRRRGALIGLWALVPFGATLALANWDYVRYWEPSMAVLCLPMAVAVLWVAGLAARRGRAPAAAVTVAVIAAWPAVVLARVVRHPDLARYPGVDDVQYVRGWAAGTGWPQIADVLDRRTAGRPFTLAYDRVRALAPYLDRPERMRLVYSGTPAALDADYLVVDYAGTMTPALRRRFVSVARVDRPRDGWPILLYRRR
jgi:hypothetical protein